MKNRMANYMIVVAVIIFFIAFIGGIAAGQTNSLPDNAFSDYKPSFNYYIMIYCWVGGFILGSVFLALSEIINRLSKLGAKFGVDERSEHQPYWKESADKELAKRMGLTKEDLKEPESPRE